MVQVSQDGLKLNGTHQLLGYADDVNTLGRSIHTTNTQKALVVASKKTGQEVNADKTKYKVMSHDQNAGQCYNIQIGFNSFDRVEKSKYLSSSWLSKNFKNKIYRTIILSIVLYGCETGLLTMREEHRLSVFVNRVPRRISGPKRDETTG
jgi:hypothetical protein